MYTNLLSFYNGEDNNFAELSGFLMVLNEFDKLAKQHKFDKPYKINLCLDSDYVIDGVHSLHKRQSANWCDGNKPVKRFNIWLELSEKFLSNKNYKIKFYNIKSHTDDNNFFSIWNGRCDNIAKIALVGGIKLTPYYLIAE